MKITWIQPYYDLILNEIPVDAKTILDVGAGYGIFGYIMKKARTATISAVEPFDYPLGVYDFLFTTTWQKFHDEKNYDVIVSTEMIEHMSHDDAIAFLDSARHRAKKVIVATPYSFERQEAYDGNQYQIHKCVVSLDDFKDNGYKTKLLGTLCFRGLVCRVYFHPRLKPLMKILGVKITNIIGVH
ncbi:MAG TPA: methyltransferase domain-containing protein [Nitrosarchaeum sp.]|nr:methyltransferase domain-containing protein [Nitrosarchaeum sp.]